MRNQSFLDYWSKLHLGLRMKYTCIHALQQHRNYMK